MTADPLATAIMVGYCRWNPTVVVTDETVTLDGRGTPLLTLPSLRVTAVSAVTVTDWRGEAVALTIGPGVADDVEWSEDGCLTCKSARLGYVFPVGRGNVSVTYSGGYEQVPDDLQAVLDHLGKRVPTMHLREERMLSAGFKYAGDGDLLLVEKLVLNRYRIVGAD